MKEPIAPSLDTHCFDEDTKTDCWSHSPEQLQEYAKQVREAALEEAALFIENGSFIHDQSPAKLFANQLAPKIRSLK